MSRIKRILLSLIVALLLSIPAYQLVKYDVVEAVQVGGAGVDNPETTQLYDAIVDCNGFGEYTSILTALATESTDASIYVRRCSYTETANVVMSSGQMIYFDDVVLTINGGYLQSAADTKIMGRLELQGTGSAAYRTLVYINSADVDWQDCEITLEPTSTGLEEGSSGLRTFDMGTSADGVTVDLIATTLDYDSEEAVSHVVRMDGVHVRGRITLDDITNTSASASKAVYGVSLDSLDDSYITVISDGIDTDTGDNAVGVYVYNTCNDLTIVGLSKGADSANYTDQGGTNIEVDALNSA